MRHRRSVRALALAGASFAICLPAVRLAAAAGPLRSPAHAARTLNVHDEGHLHFIRASGSTLLDEGHVSGTFPGSVKVRFVYDGKPTVSAKFTISGAGGSISASATGKLSSPTTPDPSFKGTLQITGGTGRYAHVHGSGQLFGVFNRRTYGLTVQAIAKLPY